MSLICIAFVYPIITTGQDNEPDFDKEFEKTAQLIVMLKADYDGIQEFGAGIIFGRQKDQLLIATAYHILHRGLLKPGKIFITFRVMPDKFLEASLLKHDDEGGLDLAVLQVDNLAKQGLNACSLSFNRLGNVAELKRRDSVYPVGNPNGVSWAIPPEADKVSQINGNNIVFQSAFISSGHSGGGLLDKNATIVGMTTADQPPFGRVINIDAVLQQVKLWGYPVQLLNILQEGSTPLHLAAKSGDVAAIKDLLEICSGNPNVTDDYNRTPLHYTASNGNIDAISLLLKAGSNLNAEDENGDTPLRYAIMEGHLESVNYLVKAGARIDIRNKDGRTAIFTCMPVEILKFLIKSGADINDQDNYKSTPLQVAAQCGNIEDIKVLLDEGAEVNKPDENGDTPLMFAVKNRKEEEVKMLLKAGAKVNIHGTFKYTPLMWVTSYNWEEGVKILLKAGANIHAVDMSGHTPLSIAISHGYPKMASLLRSLGAKN